MRTVDQLHAAAWSRLREAPVGRDLHADAHLRSGLFTASLVGGCIVATGVSPMWLLLLAPLLFGVPHVAADLRYLVLEPPRPLPRALLAGLGATFAVMTAVRVGSMTGWTAVPRVELALGTTAVALAVVWARHLPLLVLVLVLGGVAQAWPREAALLFGHAHNAVAVAIWFAWARGPARWWTLGLLGAALGLIASGWLDPWWMTVSTEGAGGLRLSGMVASLAPDLPGPWGLRAVIAFALMQAVHYALWLGGIPAVRQGGPPRAPSARWADWGRALGPGLLGLTALGTLGLLAWGSLDPTAARASYLSLVLFHGWLELAVAGFLLGSRD